MVENTLQVDVAMMRPRIVTPADMHPAAGRIDSGQGLIQNVNVRVDPCKEVAVAQVFITRVPTHGKVRTIHLQMEPVAADNIIFPFNTAPRLSRYAS